jgi:hypothetical protein
MTNGIPLLVMDEDNKKEEFIIILDKMKKMDLFDKSSLFGWDDIPGKDNERLIWAISESGRKRKQNVLEKLLVSLPEVEIPEGNISKNMPIIEISRVKQSFGKFPLGMFQKGVYKLILTFNIRNRSSEPTSISLVYFFTSGRSVSEKLEDYWWLNKPIGMDNFDSPDGLSKQFKLSNNIPPLLPEAVDELKVEIGCFEKEIIDELYKLRIHTSSSGFHDFPFRIKAEIP